MSRNYATVYTIGRREATAMPRGRFSVNWEVSASLSDTSVFGLVFGSDGGTLLSPVFFDFAVWLASGAGQSAVGKRLSVSTAVVGEMRLSVSTDRAPVELSLSGIAREASVSDYAPGGEPAISLPTQVFTFAGARLLSGSTEIPVTSATLTIGQSAEGVWRIGDDRLAAVYLGEYEVTLQASVPTSTLSVDYLRRLLNDECITGVTLSLVGCPEATCASGTSSSITFSFADLGKIVEFRAPITEIGVNETTFTIRYSRATISIG